jgi:tRNA isopentenyl-2-thiomethyl-A-37 hydroxylase MiaE
MLWVPLLRDDRAVLYDQLFVSMERARWTLSRDIDFDAIEPATLTAAWILDVREVCLTQLAALRATEMFLGDFRADIDFCSFVSVWFYEEMEHHLVLRKYLEHLGEAVEETELPRLRVSPDGAPAIDSLTLRFFGEQRLAQRYAGLATAAPEPVLSRIFSILAAGEARHAAAYATYLRRAVERNPAAFPGVLRLGLWTMRGADATAPPAAAAGGPSSASLREDRHYIRRMQGLYRLLAPDATILAEEELPALRWAAAGAP